jgi:hypothetical protein
VHEAGSAQHRVHHEDGDDRNPPAKPSHHHRDGRPGSPTLASPDRRR